MTKTKDLRQISLEGVSSFDGINTMLKDKGSNIRLAYAETVTKKDNNNRASGQTIFANDRTKQLTAHWVPNDSRRNADGNNLTYIVWDIFAPANFGFTNQFDGTAAIDASFDTWNTIKTNAKLEIVKRSNTQSNPSFILSGNPFLADISQVGFLPGIFFETYVGSGSSNNVLGVTFTFVFIDEDGNPTDINNDGADDTALKEVWYNDDFTWTDSGNTATEIDLETVALHENGHALGFGHFGKISVTKNNKLHVSPRSVMNAIILGTQRTLLGTDQASYKSIYGNWPAN
ncbi:matrixin family metalloprotease [Fodinibius sp. SL11]|uniref:matrixin family metalloprotease n=1 Tax=Fodinibius sp. SL11 TaxID=3425690 RepID=UPI003F884BD9